MIKEESIMAVTAHSEDLANKLLSYGKNVLLCNDKDTFLLDIASMKRIYIDDEEACNFLGDLDVVEYIPNKGLYRIYSGNSLDNTLILSEKCNSCCIMCPYSDHFRKNAKEVSAEHIMKLIEYIPTNPEHLTITGGEPTLIGEGIFDIMSLLNMRFPNTEYLFLTNGRIFSNQEYFDMFLQTLPHNICFGIPIYGHTPETHDKITRSEGSFSL